MTVICDTCQAANRDKAMFCNGCARKLQTFLANGPSMLSSLDTSAWRGSGSGGNRSGGDARADRPPWSIGLLLRRVTRRSWLAGAMLIVTGLASAMAWNGMSGAFPDQPASRPIETPNDGGPARSTLDETSPTDARAATPPVTARHSPEDPPPRAPAVAPGRQATGSGARSRQAPSVRPAATPSASADSPIDDPRDPHEPRDARGARDPRAGCQHLFFAFAARCTANHCLEAPYAGHPHCDQVRAEKRRDETRHDMTLN